MVLSPSICRLKFGKIKHAALYHRGYTFPVRIVADSPGHNPTNRRSFPTPDDLPQGDEVTVVAQERTDST
jgi:hypothetical protein